MDSPGFRGARPMTDQEWEYLRQHREAVNEGINRAVAHRGELIQAALVEEGADPETVAAINDPARAKEAATLPPIPQDIINRVTERMDSGEFNGPIHIQIPKDDQ